MTKPRIEDVAARAGVSAITVSRALRAPDKVTASTRARIEAAVDALGYIPNLAARSLASRQSGIVAILVPTVGNSIFSETVRGVSDAIAPAGLQLLIGDFGYSDDNVLILLRALIGRQPDALILVGVVRDPEVRRMLGGLHIPVIETWDLTDDPVDTVVGFSNAAAGAAIAEHLLAGGRRRFAFVGGLDQRAIARFGGYAETLVKAGFPPPIRAGVTAIRYAEGRRALDAILTEAPETDAVFYATDVLAVGGLLECQRRSIAVPDRMAIVGLGDLEIAGELSPGLTTIRVPSYEIGRRTGEIIGARLAGEPGGERVIDLGFSLVQRQSS
jgi:LacI family gluconate utilization system Gnt-I transcriptional repressor